MTEEQPEPRPAEKETEESSHRPCITAYCENDATITPVGCRHAACRECFSMYLGLALDAAEKDPDDVVPHGIPCIARSERCSWIE